MVLSTSPHAMPEASELTMSNLSVPHYNYSTSASYGGRGMSPALSKHGQDDLKSAPTAAGGGYTSTYGAFGVGALRRGTDVSNTSQFSRGGAVTNSSNWNVASRVDRTVTDFSENRKHLRELTKQEKQLAKELHSTNANIEKLMQAEGAPQTRIGQLSHREQRLKTLYNQTLTQMRDIQQKVAQGWTHFASTVNCDKCQVEGGNDQHLKCENCFRVFHKYCIDPPAEMPESGKWFCDDCIYCHGCFQTDLSVNKTFAKNGDKKFCATCSTKLQTHQICSICRLPDRSSRSFRCSGCTRNIHFECEGVEMESYMLNGSLPSVCSACRGGNAGNPSSLDVPSSMPSSRMGGVASTDSAGVSSSQSYHQEKHVDHLMQPTAGSLQTQQLTHASTASAARPLASMPSATPAIHHAPISSSAAESQFVKLDSIIEGRINELCQVTNDLKSLKDVSKEEENRLKAEIVETEENIKTTVSDIEKLRAELEAKEKELVSHQDKMKSLESQFHQSVQNKMEKIGALFGKLNSTPATT